MNDDDVEYEQVSQDGGLGRQMGLLGERMMALRESFDSNGGDTDGDIFETRQRGFQSLIREDYSNLDSIGDDIRFFGEELQVYNSYAAPNMNIGSIDEANETPEEENYFSPLINVLNRHKLENDSREVVKRRSLELHFGNIMATLADTEKDNSSQLLVTLRRWYNDFAWNLSRATIGLVAKSVKGVFTAVNSTLFGKSGILGLIGFGKDKKSDSQRIVDAIKEQTEFFMTGKIDQSRGFIEQLKEFGLIGASARGIGNFGLKALGLGRDLHQANEVDRAKGIDNSGRDVISKLNDRFSKFIYSDTITRYGNLDRDNPLGNEPRATSQSTPVNGELLGENALVPYLIEINNSIQRGSGLIVTQLLNSQMNGGNIYDAQMNPFSGIFEALTQANVEMVTSRHEMRRSGDAATAAIITTARNSEWRNKLQNINATENHEETLESNQLLRDELEEITTNTKNTADETRKHRRQAFFRNMMTAVGRLVMGIVSIAGSAISMLAGLLGLTKILTRGKVAAATVATAAATKTTGLGSTLLSKLKYAIGGIVAVGAVFAKGGVVAGIRGLAKGGKLIAESVKAKGVKGAGKSALDAIKSIDKTQVKAAAVIATAATVATAKRAKDMALGTLKQRKTEYVAAEAAKKASAKKASASASASAARDAASPVKEVGKKRGGVKTLGKIGGALAISGVAAMTDEKSKVGGAARTAETAATGHFIGGLLGAIVGGIAGGIGGVVAGGGVASVPMAIAGIGAGGAKGWAIGSKLGLAGGAIKGAYDNKDALSGKAQDKDDVLVNPAAAPEKSIVSPHHTPINTDIDGSTKIKSASGRNELWAKPTMEEKPEDTFSPLKAIQESIAMPVEYVKDLYENFTKVAGETVDKLVEGNDLSRDMVKTLKEMSEKMEVSASGSPFAGMQDGSLGGF